MIVRTEQGHHYEADERGVIHIEELDRAMKNNDAEAVKKMSRWRVNMRAHKYTELSEEMKAAVLSIKDDCRASV
jgi:hypothetical protein